MNLFTQLETEPTHEEICTGAVLMRGLALAEDREYLAAVETIVSASPLRHTVTPTGLPMSVMVTDCGDAHAFAKRWQPERERNWPPIPVVLKEFAVYAASRAGVCALPAGYVPHQPVPGGNQAGAASRSA